MRMDPPRGPDAATLLVRAIRAQAAAAGLTIAVRSIASRPWASATFLGMQHQIVLEAEPALALGDWIAALPEVEWSIRGHLVADVVVEPGATWLTLTILTIVAD